MAGTIHVLQNSVAQKIAAGEVIERPASVVRELLDNAIDAGSTEITVAIENGGISTIRVTDNGSGMGEEDLDLCRLPHATSKIEHEDDLLKVNSLGFRGEALAGIATCSRLEIISKTESTESAYLLKVQNGKKISLAPCRGNNGTTVEVRDLFYSLPARKHFLKSSSAESGICRSVLIEKAVCFPSIRFLYYVDGELKLTLPSQSHKERVFACYSHMLRKEFLFEYTFDDDIVRMMLIAQRPEMTRKDRKLIQIYANRRRVFEYSFTHAIEYGYSEYVPGGNFPIAFLFLDIPPDRIDFNIHPAKKEARFKDRQRLHHGISLMVKEALSQFGLQAGGMSELNRDHNRTESRSEEDAYTVRSPSGNRPSTLFDNRSSPREPSTPAGPPVVAETTFTYLGQLFNLFLLFQGEETFYIVDQHAAHERILYERFSTEKSRSNNLLVSVPFEVTDFEDKLLKINREALKKYGLTVEPNGTNQWELKSVPGSFTGPPEEAAASIKKSLAQPDSLKKELFAEMACKQAVKDGERIGPEFAARLGEEVFTLDNARCPHGRPLWFALSKRELFYLVGRL